MWPGVANPARDAGASLRAAVHACSAAKPARCGGLTFVPREADGGAGAVPDDVGGRVAIGLVLGDCDVGARSVAVGRWRGADDDPAGEGGGGRRTIRSHGAMADRDVVSAEDRDAGA